MGLIQFFHFLLHFPFCLHSIFQSSPPFSNTPIINTYQIVTSMRSVWERLSCLLQTVKGWTINHLGGGYFLIKNLFFLSDGNLNIFFSPMHITIFPDCKNILLTHFIAMFIYMYTIIEN